ncbi:MAG: P-loop ATPase, Sll1717 family [Planctomycetaceae bacterium]
MNNGAKRILPKDALQHIELGHSFAEHDDILMRRDVFVNTPALEYASRPTNRKAIFVGRRGTGKTALTKFLESYEKSRLVTTPHIFGNPKLPLPIGDFNDVRQRPFNSLVIAFKLALLAETVSHWRKRRWIEDYEIVGDLRAERHLFDEDDFDFRALATIEELTSAISEERRWLKFLNRPKRLANAMRPMFASKMGCLTIYIDRIDEDWDGSDPAVVLLMALLHAVIQINTETEFCRSLVFIRENIFERIRAIDNEFSRLETWVVSLDWTRELLLELIERRLQAPFNTKPPLGGATWSHIFESCNGTPSYDLVFQHCQMRPRDVLTYCDYAIEGAKAKNHELVSIEDLLGARRKFSENRLKDLGDEYAENYSNITLVLNRFFGLGNKFTVSGIRDLIAALSIDGLVRSGCQKWIYLHTEPERFIRLLYEIGFVGVENENAVTFREPGWRHEAMPPITDKTCIMIHPMYHDALQLSDRIIATLNGASLREDGVLLDNGMDLQEYHRLLEQQLEEIKALPSGEACASQYEAVIGRVIELCFIGRLANVEEQVRDVGNTKRRDWIAANIAMTGFWHMIMMKYKAPQVIWECKNYENLDASDFQQVRSYLNDTIGLFGVICFRGEVKKHYYEHVKEMGREGKIVLLLGDKDIRVFLRQALNGKRAESHIQECFDSVIRQVS